MRRHRDIPATLAGIVLLVLGFLPLVLLAGTPAQRTDVLRGMAEWPVGMALAGLVIVLTVVLAGRRAVPMSDVPLLPSARWIEPLLLLAAFGLPLLAALQVFQRVPLLVDEVVQVLQARTYAAGRLADTLPVLPQFTSVMHEVAHAGLRFGQFPPGWPAVLSIFVLVGVPWLAGPAVTLLTAVLFRALLCEIEPDGRTRLLALGLFVLSPFTWFMGGSHMNHGLAVAGALAGLLGTVRLVAQGTVGAALLTGIGFGAAVATRPLDGAAFALAPAVLLTWIGAVRGNRRGVVTIAALAGGVMLAAVGFVNWRTTGSPTLFAYKLLWGSSLDLGFHEAPWGPAHTPMRGLMLLNVYFLRLQTAFFESPLPGLLPALLACFICRERTTLGDRLLLAGCGLLLAGYGAYWHEGDFLGPRFVVALGPVVALWSARLPRLAAALPHRGVMLQRSAYALLAVLVLTGALFGLPVRWTQYRNGFTSMRWPLATWAAAAGVHDGVVFVRESWGTRLLARLWALDVGHTESERLYRNVDACGLEHALTRLEADARTRGMAAFTVLSPLMSDSARLRGSPVTNDTSERWLPGSPYDAPCLAEAEADSAGSLFYLPFRLLDDGNIYVRDLGARNAELRAQVPARKAWLAQRAGRGIDAGLRFVPLDSLRTR